MTQSGLFADNVALEQLRIERTPEYVYSRMVLERLGVPTAAIRVLPERNVYTADEVRAIIRGLQETGDGRVILVTSSYHTRRVKVVWCKLAGSYPGAIVRHTAG